jgi:hypothetical protein
MELQQLVRDIHWIEWQMRTYEDKYGILSRDFYRAIESGQLAEFDGEDVRSQDFLEWHGLYKVWLKREQTYRRLLRRHSIAAQFRQVRPAA